MGEQRYSELSATLVVTIKVILVVVVSFLDGHEELLLLIGHILVLTKLGRLVIHGT